MWIAGFGGNVQQCAIEGVQASGCDSRFPSSARCSRKGTRYQTSSSGKGWWRLACSEAAHRAPDRGRVQEARIGEPTTKVREVKPEIGTAGYVSTSGGVGGRGSRDPLLPDSSGCEARTPGVTSVRGRCGTRSGPPLSPYPRGIRRGYRFEGTREESITGSRGPRPTTPASGSVSGIGSGERGLFLRSCRSHS